MMLAIISKWHAKQKDFVSACPQSKIECDLFMKLPNGFISSEGNDNIRVLKLKYNLHGQKQAGWSWNDHLVAGLRKIGFESSVVDKCVFYKGQTILFCYEDDGVFAGPN